MSEVSAGRLGCVLLLLGAVGVTVTLDRPMPLGFLLAVLALMLGLLLVVMPDAAGLPGLLGDGP